MNDSILKHAIHTLRDAKNPVLYLGAGISRSAPSSIPLFGELMASYLEAIDTPIEGILVKHAGKKVKKVRDLISKLPIEAFFADISFLLGDKAFLPLSWFNNRPTNAAHEFIKILAQTLNIRTVMTPNFDCLLEKCLSDFYQIVDMKPLFRQTSILEKSYQESSALLDYVDPSINAIFHLHGTIGASVLDITPGATATPYNHFDHANLSPRLKNATILFAGCSGDYDRDVIKLLLRCDLKRGIWITHDVNTNRDIIESTFPNSWRELLREEGIALKGHTTKILAMLARREYIHRDEAEDITEFRRHVLQSFDYLNRKQRLLCMANFANQIFHGDIAMSILGDFEYENLKHDMSAANRTDIGNILTLKDCESLTLRDGRIVQAHEYLNEYERQRDIYYRYWQLMWPIAIGRARAIAVSRNPKIDNRINQAIDILKSEVFEILEKVVPYGEIGPETINFYPNVVREWMLAFESLGIFYLENGDGLLAIECIDKAKRICVAKDDWFRLEKARIIAGTKIERNPTLSPEEEKLVNKLLDRYLVRDDSSKRVNELMAIADKLYWSGDTHRCEKMYYAITAKYPENVEACLNLSNLQKETGRSEDSMKELKRGLSISPKNYKLLCNQGLLLNETGRQHDSIKILKRAIKIFPDDSYTWNNLGNSYYDLGELSKALMAYENAIKLDPSCTEAEVNRNNTLRRIGSIRRTRMDDTPLSHVFINGTCGNCKQRFRIHAEEVLHKDEFTCSNCNAVLDATKPRLMAEAMLKGATMTKKKNS